MTSTAKEKFLQDLSEILEVDFSLLNETYVLDEQTWDSLAVVSCASSIHIYYGVFPSGAKLAQCKTVGDILLYIESLVKSSSNA